MGRYYTPVQPDFVENFIYSPPWEMAAFATKRMEEPISNKLQVLNLMNNVPIEYWDDYDKENVKKIRENISSDVDEMVENLRQDVLNPRNRNAIGKYQSDLLQRFETGDIADITKTAKNKAELDKRLEKMTPYEQERIKRGLVQKAIEESEGRGSEYKVFDPGTIYDYRRLDQEFIKEMLSTGVIKPDYVEKVSVSPGKYIYKVKEGVGGLTEEKLKNAFTTWVSSKEDLQGYHNFSRDIYSQSYFNETGELDWSSGSTLDKDLQTILQAQYKDIRQDKDLSPNQVYKWESDEKKAKEEANSPTLAPTLGIDSVPDKILGDIRVYNKNGKEVRNFNLKKEREEKAKNILMSNIPEKSRQNLDRFIVGTYGSYDKFLSATNREKGKMLSPETLDLVGIDERTAKMALNELSVVDKNYKFQASWDVVEKAVGKKNLGIVKGQLESLAASKTYSFSVGSIDGKGVSTNKLYNYSNLEEILNENTEEAKDLKKRIGIPEDAQHIVLSYKENSATPFGPGVGTFLDNMPAEDIPNLPTRVGIKVTYDFGNKEKSTNVINAYVPATDLTALGSQIAYPYQTE